MHSVNDVPRWIQIYLYSCFNFNNCIKIWFIHNTLLCVECIRSGYICLWAEEIMIIQITFVRRICGPTEVKNQLGGFHHSFNTLQDGQWLVVIQKEKNRLDDGNAPWREITITLNRIKRHSVDTADWFFFSNNFPKCIK